MKKQNFLWLLVVFTITVNAQEETTRKKICTIITDRPDQTESSTLITKTIFTN
jgi:hypothetical protein